MKNLEKFRVTKRRMIWRYGPLFFGMPLTFWQALTEAPFRPERPVIGAMLIVVGNLAIGYLGGALFGWMWWNAMHGGDTSE